MRKGQLNRHTRCRPATTTRNTATQRSCHSVDNSLHTRAPSGSTESKRVRPLITVRGSVQFLSRPPRARGRHHCPMAPQYKCPCRKGAVGSNFRLQPQRVCRVACWWRPWSVTVHGRARSDTVRRSTSVAIGVVAVAVLCRLTSVDQRPNQQYTRDCTM